MIIREEYIQIRNFFVLGQTYENKHTLWKEEATLSHVSIFSIHAICHFANVLITHNILWIASVVHNVYNHLKLHYLSGKLLKSILLEKWSYGYIWLFLSISYAFSQLFMTSQILFFFFSIINLGYIICMCWGVIIKKTSINILKKKNKNFTKLYKNQYFDKKNYQWTDSDNF